MSEAKFKPGDVVRLKSGGPLMTITDFGYDPKASVFKVIWMDAQGRMQRDAFSVIEILMEKRNV